MRRSTGRAPYRSARDMRPPAIRDQVAEWLARRTSLLAAVRSKVLPEADVVMMNPRHPDAAGLRPLVLRPFSFVECLHTPPMLEAYERGKQR